MKIDRKNQKQKTIYYNNAFSLSPTIVKVQNTLYNLKINSYLLFYVHGFHWHETGK